MDEAQNKAFKEKVLENTMFDAYDKQIILAHLSNFYCVFQLGWDAGREELKKEKVETMTESEEEGNEFDEEDDLEDNQ